MKLVVIYMICMAAALSFTPSVDAASEEDSLTTSALQSLNDLEFEWTACSQTTDSDTSNTKALLKSARTHLERLRRLEGEVRVYEREAAQLAGSMQSPVAELLNESDFDNSSASTLSAKDLTALLVNLQRRLDSEDAQLNERLSTAVFLNQRAQQITEELEQLASTSWVEVQSSTSQALSVPPALLDPASSDFATDSAGDLLEYRSRTLVDEILALRQSVTVKLLRREQATLVPRQRLYGVYIQQSRQTLEILEQYVVIYSDYLADDRASAAGQLIDELQEQFPTMGEASTQLQAIELQNVTLSRRLLSLAERWRKLIAEAQDARRALRRLKQSQSTASDILAVRAMNESSGELLRELRTELPVPQQVQASMTRRVEELSDLQTNMIVWRDLLDELQDAAVPVLERLTREPADAESAAYGEAVPTRPTDAANELTVTDTDTSINSLQNTGDDAQEFANRLLEQQVDILNRLLDLAGELSGQLNRLSETLSSVYNGSQSLSVLLDRQLLWLRNRHKLDWEWLLTIPAGIGWLLSPVNWMQSVVHFADVVKQQPFVAVSLMLFPIAVYKTRRTLRASLVRAAGRVGKVGRDTYATTPWALLLSVLLAAPIPALILVLAWLMNQAQTADTYSQALVLTLTRVGALIFLLNIVRGMCRSDGLMTQHFGWSESARKTLHRHLGWFIAIQCLCAYVFLMSTMSGDLERQYGIGLIAFLIASISIAHAAFHVFRPASGIVSSIAEGTPPSLPGRLLFPFAVLTPLLIGLLPFVGYFDTAVILQSKLFQTGYLFVVAAIVYGLLLRLYSVAHRRFALVRARQRRAQLEAERLSVAEGQGSGEAVPISDDELADSNSRISDQARNTLAGTTLVLFSASLWLIWRPLFPAFSIADEIVLYRSMGDANGLNTDQSVSLWNVVKALAILYVAFWSASNIRGLLEVSLFQRLNLDAGARYAFTAITGYLLIGTGLVAGFAQLGVDWSKLQWIVAALGVGLGFGLQEIVANFISGLVILFERPIRVGDIVTIGTQSGTVRYIRIRATTITDFDNRDVILPNKQVVTENVVNWTLHDSVTRLLLTVGIAYGSDIEKARQLITAVVEAHPDVMDKPEPSVLFMRHGDSSLDFEVRVFVEQTMRRLLLTHELNSAINRALLSNGFEIPFPQRVVHLQAEGHLARA